MKSFFSFSMVLPVALLCACSSSNEPAKAADPGTCPALDPASLKGGTLHQGDILSHEVWKASDSPHVIKADVNVRNGGMLTIEPCAVVKIARDANLNVAYPLTPNEGTLVAVGTADAPIAIRAADAGPWGRVFVNHPGTAKLAYVTLEGGGGGDAELGESLAFLGDAVLPSKHGLWVDHVTVRKSRGAGVRVWGGAAFDLASTALTITASGDMSSPYPLVVGELAVDSIPVGTYAGNARDEIQIDVDTVSGGGGFLESTTMHDRGVPYRFGRAPDIDELQLGGSAATTTSPTLTIEAGVTLKMVRGVAIHIDGSAAAPATIKALGTAEKPVVITSAEATPKPGDWRGLYFNGRVSEGNVLDHVRIEYTGADCHCSLVTCSPGVSEYEAALIFGEQPASAFLKNSVIAHASGHAIVQGFHGTALDWKTSNTFEDVAGCIATLPTALDTSCPDMPPACR